MEKGVIKKIDELGRVVIPKDIRNNLKLKTGDILNINVDNDVIKLTKHSDPEGYKDTLRRIVDIFKDVFEIDILITDREKIIVTSNELYYGKLDEFISNKIVNGEYYYGDEKKALKIGEVEVNNYIYVEPLITSLSSVGAIILFSSVELNSYYVKVMKFLSKYIENLFDISC